MSTSAQVITRQDFSQYLQHIRAYHHLTQESLAQQLGCTQNYIWRLEKGQRHPSKMFLQVLRHHFGDLPEDAALLHACEQMIDYRCDQIEFFEDERHVLPRHLDMDRIQRVGT